MNKKEKIMKKHLFIGLMLFISANTFAQIDKIIGDWVEKKRIQIDTTSSGRDIMNQDPDAYRKGYKKLSSEYVDLGDRYPLEGFELKITITKEQDFFWAIDENKFMQRIAYDSASKNYSITIPDYFNHINLIVKYDEVSNKLQFIKPVPGEIYIFYEFERKK
ncbi:hypothetical protein [Flavobacterium sp.]|uniref:hypothetical protein n=1 Tax=Flavobacterium sp. TaxID=239 RepID=UPI003C37476E